MLKQETSYEPSQVHPLHKRSRENRDPTLIRRVQLIERLEEQRRLAKDPTLAPIIKRWKKDRTR